MTMSLPKAEGVELTARQSRAPVALDQVAVLLETGDHVAIAKVALMPGSMLVLADGSHMRVSQVIPPGHKVAVASVSEGKEVHRYGQIIGFASQDIAAGQHVHEHNLAVKEFGRDYAFCEDYQPVEILPEAERRTFMGFRRSDGRVGARNYVAVLASVNCSASATARVAEYFRQPGVLDDYPNVDGVIGLPHKGGCGAHIGSRDLYIFQRTLAGIVHHPNVGGYVILSLGCEVNQPSDMIDATSMIEDSPLVITIQQDGGFLKTVELGIEAVKRILPEANKAVREPVPASLLMVAVQCGGSVSLWGVTAKCCLGMAGDVIV